jgi:hypothetical protein
MATANANIDNTDINNTRKKLMATFLSVIVFAIIASPFTYKLTNRILGGVVGSLADPSGCPTILGLVVHSVVFGIIVFLLMGLKL